MPTAAACITLPAEQSDVEEGLAAEKFPEDGIANTLGTEVCGDGLGDSDGSLVELLLNNAVRDEFIKLCGDRLGDSDGSLVE